METEGHPLAGLQILVADDNVDGADSLAALLQLMLQCRVDTVYDGAQALAHVLDRRPDAVILDIRMPRLGGIEVARQIRRVDGYHPLLLAMTGNADIAEDLVSIDQNFDHAFAKPVEADSIVQALAQRWQAAPETETAAPFELSELFTRAVRDMSRTAKAGGHTLSFDYRGPAVVLGGDEAALHASFYRIMCAAADFVKAGFLILSAEVQCETDNRCLVIVTAAGTGEAVAPARTTEILARLALADDASADRDERRAGGSCPYSGGKVAFASRATEGTLLRLEFACTPLEVDDGAADARAATAWIVSADEVPGMLLERRLQRLGWRCRRFANDAEALAEFDASLPAVPPATPRLLIVAAPAAALRLRRRKPPRTHGVLAVAPDSAPTADAEAAGCDVRLAPLSPRELIELTQEASEHPDVPRTRPSTLMPFVRMPSKPLVLVVDDNHVNRVVATGLVEALGYDAVSVNDGLDAIEMCKRTPPSIVLMDINMPVLGGLDATRRLRELQQLGRVAPFAIIAATADADSAMEADCAAAGMDGFLAKPLRLSALAQELARVAPAGRPARRR